jgi:hypothetical protein
LFDGNGSTIIRLQENRYDCKNYKNGKLEGLRSVYYQAVKLQKKPVNNVKEGVYKSFLIMELYLKNQFIRYNEYNGPATFKDQGNVVSKGVF